MNWLNGLTEETQKVFEQISKLECIKNLYLCGGTAISLQLQHRKSEDLDFEQIITFGEKKELNISEIATEIQNNFPNSRKEILGNDHIIFYTDKNVKISFFKPENRVPTLNKGFVYNNLKTVSKQDLLGMKLYVINVRNTFRDYYDIYALLKAGCDLKKGIEYAGKFSKNKIHSKQIYTTLQTPVLFKKEKSFDLLNPTENIDSNQISNYIKTIIQKEQKNKLKI